MDNTLNTEWMLKATGYGFLAMMALTFLIVR